MVLRRFDHGWPILKILNNCFLIFTFKIIFVFPRCKNVVIFLPNVHQKNDLGYLVHCPLIDLHFKRM